MRSLEEIQEKLLYCKQRRSFWRDTMWRTETTETWEGEHARAQKNYQIWHDRVKTLEFVLGDVEVI